LLALKAAYQTGVIGHLSSGVSSRDSRLHPVNLSFRVIRVLAGARKETARGTLIWRASGLSADAVAGGESGGVWYMDRYAPDSVASVAAAMYVDEWHEACWMEPQLSAAGVQTVVRCRTRGLQRTPPSAGGRRQSVLTEILELRIFFDRKH
jgi:hypothetical protein